MDSLDTIVFETDLVRVGKFRCAASHPRFRDSGPTSGHLVVFPRTAVWIRHAGATQFLADPRVATIYNRAQEYTRDVASVDGDRCDWFSVNPELALDIARASDQGFEDPDRPFLSAFVGVDPELYLRQRRLLAQLERGCLSAFEAEERVVEIVAAVIRRSAAQRPRMSRRRRRSRGVDEAHVELADRARAVITRDACARPTVAELAKSLCVSPFHLCRVFREQTGVSMHAYRTQVRMRLALERLTVADRDISRVAFELGFSSHSHFAATLGKHYHATPSAVRASLLLPAG
jgi:AraC-like DNA-binding protein